MAKFASTKPLSVEIIRKTSTRIGNRGAVGAGRVLAHGDHDIHWVDFGVPHRPLNFGENFTLLDSKLILKSSIKITENIYLVSVEDGFLLQELSAHDLERGGQIRIRVDNLDID